MGKEATRVRRRERKNIASGVAHVNSSFNNTTITITDAQGNTIAWSSAVRASAGVFDVGSPAARPPAMIFAMHVTRAVPAISNASDLD